MIESLPNKIAVLSGGPSCEREISLISGSAVSQALSSKGFQVLSLDPSDTDFVSTLKKEKISLVFLALHGTFGEDGQIQQILDREGISYAGSGAVASDLAFHKDKAQKIFKENGILIPTHQVLEKNNWKNQTIAINGPWVVKPSAAGSSVGVSIVSLLNELTSACEEAFKYSQRVLVEQYIPGRELTVGILGDQALPIIEVGASKKFYDFEAKYQSNQTSYIVPAILEQATAKLVTETALLAYQALGCQVMGRADLILGKDGRVYVLELNTIPGFTPKSLLPKAAKAMGVDFPDLCVRILELSLQKTYETIKK